MSRLQRKLLKNCLALGGALTLLVAILHVTRALNQPEVWLYDRRAQLCQHFSPPPTDKLVHLDIDDKCHDVIGRWPWPRKEWVELLDGIHRAGPKAVELDFMFDDPQPSDDSAMADVIGRA